MTNKQFDDLFGQPRKKIRKMINLTQFHMDIASSIQVSNRGDYG